CASARRDGARYRGFGGPAAESARSTVIRAMRAYVLAGPGDGSVQEVPAAEAGPGEVVIDVERVGLCGTDVEFFTGEMAYLHSGHASYPIRLGPEGAGRGRAV